MDTYFLRSGYRARDDPRKFLDSDAGIFFQPRVYAIAFWLAKRYGLSSIIDIGCGNGGKLAETPFDITGIDHGKNLGVAKTHGRGRWLDWDIDNEPAPTILEADLYKSLIICADVIEHLVHPEKLLTALMLWMRDAPVLVISTPDRDRVRGLADLGPPGNRNHVREWAAEEFRLLMGSYGLSPWLMGHTIGDERSREKTTILAIVAP